jgi:hypothetical protein
VGASTGYRWFVPKRASLANHVLYSINAAAATMYNPRTLQPVWGGSWAMRRAVYDRLRVRARWRGMLTDDLSVTNFVREAGLSVAFEPACVVPSPVDATIGEAFAFLQRQYLIGRHFLPGWWAATLAASTATVVGVGAAAAMLAWGAAMRASWVWMPGVICALWYALSVTRAVIRRDMMRRFGLPRCASLARATRFDMWLAPVAAAVNWMAIARSALSRRTTWRGVTYRLLPAGQACIERREGTREVAMQETSLKAA